MSFIFKLDIEILTIMKTQNIKFSLINYVVQGPGEMAPWLRPYTIFPEDLGLHLRTHITGSQLCVKSA